MDTLRKFPRTPHLLGSRRQAGDEDLPTLDLRALRGRDVVITEKLDGANAAISFGSGGELRLQSRGHFLTGGPRERQFGLFKSWTSAHRVALFDALGSRYVLYGEWLYAKHTAFYDALPHYFLAFDVLDTHDGRFLATPERERLLRNSGIVSVPVLWSGRVSDARWLSELLGPSHYRSASWRAQLAECCARCGQGLPAVLRETDDSNLMEGLYIKSEEGGRVIERAKYVRDTFTAAVDQSGSHWLDRPILPNGLRAGVQLFGVHGAVP